MVATGTGPFGMSLKDFQARANALGPDMTIDEKLRIIGQEQTGKANFTDEDLKKEIVNTSKIRTREGLDSGLLPEEGLFDSNTGTFRQPNTGELSRAEGIRTGDIDPSGLTLGEDVTTELGIDSGIGKLLDFLKTERDTQRTREEEQLAAERAGLTERISGLSGQIGGLREKLIGDITGRGNEALTGLQGRNKAGLEELSGLLNRERDQAFNLNAPGIMEQLSGRGLLRSTGTGEALAREQARLQDISQNELTRAGLAGRSQEEAIRQQMQEQITGIGQAGLGFEQQLGSYGLGANMDLSNLDMGSLRELNRAGLSTFENLGSAGLERRFGQEDDELDRILSEKIANIQGNATRSAGNAQAGGNIIGGLLSLIPGL